MIGNIFVLGYCDGDENLVVDCTSSEVFTANRNKFDWICDVDEDEKAFSIECLKKYYDFNFVSEISDTFQITDKERDIFKDSFRKFKKLTNEITYEEYSGVIKNGAVYNILRTLEGNSEIYFIIPGYGYEAFNYFKFIREIKNDTFKIVEVFKCHI